MIAFYFLLIITGAVTLGILAANALIWLFIRLLAKWRVRNIRCEICRSKVDLHGKMSIDPGTFQMRSILLCKACFDEDLNRES